MPNRPKTHKPIGPSAEQVRAAAPGRAARKRFYDSVAWQSARAEQLKREPLCRECARRGDVVPACEVDHVIPLEHGGAPLDQSNLQSLCKVDHSTKTRSGK